MIAVDQPRERRPFAAGFWDGLEPEPLLTVSQWADRYRILSKKAAAEAGQWRTSRTPYLREPMDSLSATSPVHTVSVMAGAQIGKALALTTPIPTPDGWTTMGRLQVGDTVLDADGKPTRVTFATPFQYGRECFRVRFSDGAELVADRDHRWYTEPYRGRPGVRTTAEVRETLTSGRRNTHAVPVAGALELPERNLPVPPYTLGVWLGDGNSRCTQVTSPVWDAGHIAECIRAEGVHVTVRQNDLRHPVLRNLVLDSDPAICGRGHELAAAGAFEREGGRKPRCRECHRQVSRRFQSGHPAEPKRPSLRQALIDLGILTQDSARAVSKHIPEVYLRASIHQRLELLRGLMDTDGSCTRAGRQEFSTSFPGLALGFGELLSSLGLKFTVRVAQPRKETHRASHRFSFMAYAETEVFKLPRKFARQRSRHEPGARVSETERRRIVAVEPVDSVPVRCITVDSPLHLFLAGREMVPTHNTETGNNWIGYIIDMSPAPTMAVAPTQPMAQKNSRTRIDPLIQESPRLSAKVAPQRSRNATNTVELKEFPGGILALVGANSPASLRSMPIQNLFLDEIDAYPGDVGGEGDPCELVEARARTFRRRKILKTSTPTFHGRSRIHDAFLAGDQRLYYVPCPHCDHMQTLSAPDGGKRWQNLKWEKGKPETAAWACDNCGALIEERFKEKMLARGEWRPHNANAPRGVRSYHISSLYSPWFTWAEIARKWEDAQGDVAKTKTFINTILAEPWKEHGDAPRWQRLYNRREKYKIGTVPAGGVLLTAGGDVQKDRIELEIVAFGRGLESWSIDYVVLEGDTSEDEVWQKLEEQLERTFEHESGGNLKVSRLAIDSGYLTTQVYSWARGRHPRVMAVKGREGVGLPIVGLPTKQDIAPHGRKKIRRGVMLWPVGTWTGKEELYGWLRREQPVNAEENGYPVGWCHFPEYPEEYFLMLTAEQVVTTVNARGFQKREWRKTRERNEALDCRVYARAAAAAEGIDRWTDAEWDALEGVIHGAKRTTKKKRDRSRGLAGDGYLDRWRGQRNS